MALLRLVYGYLEVLGSYVAQFTRSLPHLSRLTQALLQVPTAYTYTSSPACFITDSTLSCFMFSLKSRLIRPKDYKDIK